MSTSARENFSIYCQKNEKPDKNLCQGKIGVKNENFVIVKKIQEKLKNCQKKPQNNEGKNTKKCKFTKKIKKRKTNKGLWLCFSPFAEGCLRPIFDHWEGRLKRWSITFDALHTEFKAMVTVAESLRQLVESALFWQRIISNWADFTQPHCFLRMCLQVEVGRGFFSPDYYRSGWDEQLLAGVPFSKLRRFLTDHRVLLDVALVEQLMVLCWSVYWTLCQGCFSLG